MGKTTFFTWTGRRTTGNDQTAGDLGGDVLALTAGATLNIGDIVYISGSSTVNKSTTTSNRPLAIGVVVGGALTNDEPAMEDYSATAIAAGVPAANVNQRVYVCVRGIVYVVADGAISVGAQITASASTAGRATAAANYTVAAGGTAVTSSAANGAIINGDGTSGSIGKMLEASTGAAQVRKAYIRA